MGILQFYHQKNTNNQKTLVLDLSRSINLMTVRADWVRYFFKYLGVRRQRTRVSQPEYSPAQSRQFHWENVHSMHKGNREASDVTRLHLHDI